MSRSKSRPVVLSPAERELLVKVVRTGSHPAQEVRRARILLELDDNDPGREKPVPAQEVVAQRAGGERGHRAENLEGVRRAR